jgi:probable HAF family extracellular repeat protein
MSDLGTIGGLYSAGLAINSSHQITGFSTLLGNDCCARHAFLYSNGTMTDIGTLGGNFSAGFGINAWGQITGQSSLPGDGVFHAFLYSNGTLKDLNDLLPTGSGWQLVDGQAINKAGQITGIGLNPSGVAHDFLLTPIYKAFVQQPVNADGSSVFKANRGVIPVKFTVTQYNSPSCTLPATIAITRAGGGTLAAVDESTYSTQAETTVAGSRTKATGFLTVGSLGESPAERSAGSVGLYQPDDR